MRVVNTRDFQKRVGKTFELELLGRLDETGTERSNLSL